MKKGIIATLLVLLFLVSACSDYSVKVSASPESASPGGKGDVAVSLSAHGDWYINPDAPVMIKFTSPEGVKLERDELSHEDRGTENTFKTGFNVGKDAKSGNKVIKADIFFSICTEELCKLIQEEHDIALRIK